VRLHLDTDFGGDPDDACALALLLAWPGVELAGVTTNLEVGGQRAGCARHYLTVAGRPDVPVAAGAEATLTALARFEPTWGDRRHWPDPVEPLPAPAGAALDLLERSIEAGATIVAIGSFTNLALLEVLRPGRLEGVRVVAMAGWLEPPAPGLPPWGPEADFNVQCDPRAAEIVAGRAELTLVTLPATLAAHLRRDRDLPRLRRSGAVGALLARQSETHGRDQGMEALGRAHAALPDDLVNFHHDPVTAAVAAGWESGVTASRMPLVATTSGGVLRFEECDRGRPATVVTAVDGDGFAALWLERIEGAFS
jgi:inosine-uridine nucleoside N-ribohydrolase